MQYGVVLYINVCGVVWCGVMNFILLTWSSKASTDVLTLWPVSALVSKYFKPKFSAKALASFSSTALCSSKSALFPIRTKNRKKLVCQCNPSTSCQKVNLTESRKPHLSNKTWRCGHSNESSRWVHSNGTVCVITEESSSSCKPNLKVWPLKWKLLMSTF